MKKLIFVLGFIFCLALSYGQTHSERLLLSKNAEFRGKVQISILMASFLIVGEDTASYSPDRVEKRHALAMKVIANPQGYASKFALFCAAGGYLSASSSDSDIDFTVATLWNDISGIKWDD